jgi:hypothetical protein
VCPDSFCRISGATPALAIAETKLLRWGVVPLAEILFKKILAMVAIDASIQTVSNFFQCQHT